MEVDIADLSESDRGRILKAAVSPRPIAWISTTSETGVDNLAPFSSFNYVSWRRPVLAVSSRTDAGEGYKDSIRNAIETEVFAVNVVTEALLERMDRTAASIPSDESEFDHADVARADCRRIDVPRVADAAVSMECRLHDTVEVFDRVMVLGEVVYVHVDDAVTTDGRIDARLLDTVGALGGSYFTVSEPLDLDRD